MLTKFRGDLFVGVCWLGLTVLAVVVVEMQGEISHQWEIWWRSQWGGMLWSARE
jgi:hypothetical protein